MKPNHPNGQKEGEPLPYQTPDFVPMFRDGTRYRVQHSEDGPHFDVVVKVRDAGGLHLATGRLVACDPLRAPAFDPFEQGFSMTVPPGHYPVSVSMAHRIEPGDTEASPTPVGAAAVRLTVCDEPVARWQPAVRPSDDPAAIWDPALTAFAANRGVGAFLDGSALAPLSRLVKPGQGLNSKLDELIDELLDEYIVTTLVDETMDLNVIMFLSALGPGSYTVWLGRTTAHEPVCFIADLELFSTESSTQIVD